MEEETVMELPSDLSELCRVCLQIPHKDDNLDVTIIYDEDDNLTYAECFTICTHIDLAEGDNVPHCLCKSCGLELQVAYDFYKKVEESNRSLEQYQQQMEENEAYTSVEINAKPTDNDGINQDYDEDDNGNTNTIQEEVFSSTGETKHPSKLSKSETEIIDLLVGHKHEDDIVDDDNATNEGEVSIVLEEHFETANYNDVEIIEDVVVKTGSTPTKSSSKHKSSKDLQINTSKEYFLEDIDRNKFARIPMETDEEEEEEEEREDEPQNIEESAESWEENVVVVANKEHLPLESSESKKSRPLNSEFHYELIETDNTDMYQAELDAMNVDKRDSKEMSVHSRKRHVGSYCCDVCNKEYPNYSRMMAHRRCHEADRPKYPCKHCNRIYATKQAMECHVQTFHNKTGFTCSVCQKVFAIRRSLEVHMRFHNGDFPFACNLCDKKFAQIGHLNTHKNVKHNHVRFGCDFPNCGKFFTSSTSLRNHEFTHGIMPFECQYCQRGYPAKSKLRVHIKRKHGIDPSKEELEDMRKFHVMRSKVNLVKVVPADEEEDES